MSPAALQSFATIDKLVYHKVWDTSGECVVLRETWSEGGKVVRTVVHDYLKDNPPPEPESEVVTIGMNDIGKLDVSKLDLA